MACSIEEQATLAVGGVGAEDSCALCHERRLNNCQCEMSAAVVDAAESACSGTGAADCLTRSLQTLSGRNKGDDADDGDEFGAPVVCCIA